MKLEDGKKYRVECGKIGIAKRPVMLDGRIFYDTTAMYFPDDVDSPELPIYYYDKDKGRSNLSYVLHVTKYDVVEEVKE